jgi:hypothetical protein
VTDSLSGMYSKSLKTMGPWRVVKSSASRLRATLCVLKAKSNACLELITVGEMLQPSDDRYKLCNFSIP